MLFTSDYSIVQDENGNDIVESDKIQQCPACRTTLKFFCLKKRHYIDKNNTKWKWPRKTRPLLAKFIFKFGHQK
jgi:hypothetical protein